MSDLKDNTNVGERYTTTIPSFARKHFGILKDDIMCWRLSDDGKELIVTPMRPVPLKPLNPVSGQKPL